MDENFGWINLYNPEEDDVREYDRTPGFFGWVIGLGMLIYFSAPIAVGLGLLWLVCKGFEALYSAGKDDNLERWLDSPSGEEKGE